MNNAPIKTIDGWTDPVFERAPTPARDVASPQVTCARAGGCAADGRFLACPPTTQRSSSLVWAKELMAIPIAFILVAVWILGVFYDWPSMGVYIHVLLGIAVLIFLSTYFRGYRGRAKQ